MGRDSLLIGEVASRSGVSRKARRLYERVFGGPWGQKP
jgi:DNA-binding transcriptional MerR regulator